MEAIILCGGLGTRLAEETLLRPKPMVHIGGMPILWHIMKIYAHYGLNDFYLALGYKGNDIKQYFINYYASTSDIRLSLKNGKTKFLNPSAEDWNVNLIDTGRNTMTGGRLLRLKPYLRGNTFMLTYGDGVADIDIHALLQFHHDHGKIATMTAVRPPARFGTMQFNDDRVIQFQEKAQVNEGWINGGFFVFERAVFDYLYDDNTILERHPLETLANNDQLVAYKHHGFWQPMDTIRDRDFLNQCCDDNQASWTIWK